MDNGDTGERRRLRGPLAPLRLFLSSGRTIGRAGKWGLAKVRRPLSRPGPVMASVTAERFCGDPEEHSEERRCEVLRDIEQGTFYWVDVL
jgi:hypothetical protein